MVGKCRLNVSHGSGRLIYRVHPSVRKMVQEPALHSFFSETAPGNLAWSPFCRPPVRRLSKDLCAFTAVCPLIWRSVFFAAGAPLPVCKSESLFANGRKVPITFIAGNVASLNQSYHDNRLFTGQHRKNSTPQTNRMKSNDSRNVKTGRSMLGLPKSSAGKNVNGIGNWAGCSEK